MSTQALADNHASLAGMYGTANNQLAAWLLGRGQGELLALSPAELRRDMPAPRCKAGAEEQSTKTGRWHPIKGKACGETMRYRPTGWACYQHKEPQRQPLGMVLQDAPTLIDFGDGPEKYVGSIAQLLAMAGKTVDVAYKADRAGEKATWRYVVQEAS